MPVQNRRKVKQLLDKAALLFGVSSTDKDMGVPPEIDDDGYLKVVLKTIGDTLFNFVGNCLEVVRGKGGIKTSGILTSSTQVLAAPGDVYWITACADDVLTFRICDSDTGDDAARYRWGQFYPADDYSHYIFDPPIECDAGIYITITTSGNAEVVVGYK